jgi:hypothetical protein
VALGAPIRDLAQASQNLVAALGPAAGYTLVFALEIALLLAALATMLPLLSRAGPAAPAHGYPRNISVSP